MKLTLHLIDGNRLIATPDWNMQPSQAMHVADVLERWNKGEITELLLPCESEIIDMRTPQKEELEAFFWELMTEHDKKFFDLVLHGTKGT